MFFNIVENKKLRRKEDMKFGVREIVDVVFKAAADNQRIGDRTFKKYQPVFKIDTAQTSSLEQSTTTVYAQGGKGYARLIAWEGEKQMTFTVTDALAEAIAKKIKKAEAQKQEKQQKVNLEDISVYGKYISILSVGLKKDKNELSDYTIYQLKDEFKRFLLNQDFDMYVKMKIAGAENLDEVEDWMQNTVI